METLSKILPDERLVSRHEAIQRSLLNNCLHSIRQLTTTSSEAKGFYRFLQNERVDEDLLISNMASRCAEASRGKMVLCIQDTTEINLYNHKNRLKRDNSIGSTNSSDHCLGFLMHPSLVIDAQSYIPYGFSHIKLWSRPEDMPKKSERGYKKLPIEQKESYKWIESSEQARDILEETEFALIVQDREGDIFEQFARIPNSKTGLLIRAKSNRTLLDSSKLFTTFSDQPAQCFYEITIETDHRKGREKRDAQIAVRYKQISIKRPAGLSRELPTTVSLYLIEAREINSKAKNPICWRLLTTMEVEDNQTALTCIEWYSCRWMIEEVFRILKKEGFNIEASELEYGKSIRKLTLLMLDTIMKLFMMQICYAIPEEEGLPPESCFSIEAQECLEVVTTNLEGKTQQLKNIYSKTSLKRYAWTIARLGGWKGHKKERPPGITTLWIGLQRFGSLKTGWKLARDVSTR